MLSIIKEEFKKRNVMFKDNMILSYVQPHTAPVEHLKECCSGVITSQYYFTARYFDLIDDNLASGIVSELAKLQMPDGCMRWYREEEFITDTNGAFFVLMPLALAYKFCSDKMTEGEKTNIQFLLKNALKWFSHETEGSLHYCNKIMSDGAMLALISNIIGDGKETSDDFWEKWDSYYAEHGWGWGENSSDCYSTIMLNALNTVIISSDGKTRENALKRREELVDYIIFHEGKEFVPTIRTYNFDAKATYGGAVYSVLKAECQDAKGVSPNVDAAVMTILVHESGLKTPKEANSNVRKELLFNDSFAYTWKGKSVRLGSVSHFPVMPCSYQNCVPGAGGYVATYGLGWQSMPVSAMVDEKYISFLRIRTKVGEKEHFHPAVDKHSAYLYNRLFEDGNITVFSTRSAQDNNIAVVCRSANKLTNTASFICDEWCIPDKNAKIDEQEFGGRKWFVVYGENAAVALLPLDGIVCENLGRSPMKTYISESGIFKTVTTELYSGEEKLVTAQRTESVWAVVAIDNTSNVAEYLENIEISDEPVRQIDITLNSAYLRRKIACTDGKSIAELFIDPTAQHDF